MPDDAIEKRRQANRESYQRNKEKRLEKNRQWREANPDKMKSYNRDWYTKNRERALAARQKYRAENPEKMRVLVRKWYLDNKEKTIGTARFQRTGCTPEQYKALLAKQDGRCAICHRLPGKNALAADHCHTTKVVRGLLCYQCNSLLGMAGDSIDVLKAAISYLDGASGG